MRELPACRAIHAARGTGGVPHGAIAGARREPAAVGRVVLGHHRAGIAMRPLVVRIGGGDLPAAGEIDPRDRTAARESRRPAAGRRRARPHRSRRDPDQRARGAGVLRRQRAGVRAVRALGPRMRLGGSWRCGSSAPTQRGTTTASGALGSLATFPTARRTRGRHEATAAAPATDDHRLPRSDGSPLPDLVGLLANALLVPPSDLRWSRDRQTPECPEPDAEDRGAGPWLVDSLAVRSSDVSAHQDLM
jgi:hypothetical protein